MQFRIEYIEVLRPPFLVQGVQSFARCNGDGTHRLVILPLRHELASALAEHMANYPPTARAFRLWNKSGAKMLKADLETVTIPYVDEYGRQADFHALRHSFITLLADAGVHPKTAQDLARHSNVNLTMAVYTHTQSLGTD